MLRIIGLGIRRRRDENFEPTGVFLSTKCELMRGRLRPIRSRSLELRMTALAQALSRFGGSDVETETLKLIATFCAAGLFVSVLWATYGLDLSPGFF